MGQNETKPDDKRVALSDTTTGQQQGVSSCN